MAETPFGFDPTSILMHILQLYDRPAQPPVQEVTSRPTALQEIEGAILPKPTPPEPGRAGALDILGMIGAALGQAGMAKAAVQGRMPSVQTLPFDRLVARHRGERLRGEQRYRQDVKEYEASKRAAALARAGIRERKEVAETQAEERQKDRDLQILLQDMASENADTRMKAEQDFHVRQNRLDREFRAWLQKQPNPEQARAANGAAAGVVYSFIWGKEDENIPSVLTADPSRLPAIMLQLEYQLDSLGLSEEEKEYWIGRFKADAGRMRVLQPAETEETVSQRNVRAARERVTGGIGDVFSAFGESAGRIPLRR